MTNKLIDLKKELDELKEAVKRNAIFSLQTSFECNTYQDIPNDDINCPICEGLIEKPVKYKKISNNFWNTSKLTRIECPHCNVIFGPISVINKEPNRLAEDYKILYAYYAEGETEFYQQMAFEALEPEKSKIYLNFACGTWKNGIEELRTNGWNIYGYEPNLSFQHDFIKSNIDDLKILSFNGLFTHNFIEHIQHPVMQFIEWNSLLKIGDKMVHSTACFEWKFDFSNFHIFFLLGKSLEILASRTGFKIIKSVDYEPDIDLKFTRLVVFEKIKEIEFDKWLGYKIPGSSTFEGSNESIIINSESILPPKIGEKTTEMTALQNDKIIKKIREENERLLYENNELLTKTKVLQSDLSELTALYNTIIHSNSWKISQSLKKIVGRK